MRNPHRIGKLIRSLRVAKGLRQEDIGKQLGIKSGMRTVGNWEKDTPVPARHIPKLAEALGVFEAELLDSNALPVPCAHKPGNITAGDLEALITLVNSMGGEISPETMVQIIKEMATRK